MDQEQQGIEQQPLDIPPEGAQQTGAQGQDSPPDDSDTGAQPQDGQEQQPTVQDRINELTRHRRVAERVAAEAIEQANRRDQELAQMRAYFEGLQRGGTPAVQPQQPDGPPKPEQFTDWGDYTRAVAQFEAREIMRQNASEQEQQQRQEQQRRAEQVARHAHNVREATLQTAVEQGTEKYPDFVKAISNPSLPSLRTLHPSVLDALAYSEVAPDVMYYLGKNPQEAHRVAALHPTLAIREIGKLEQRLSSGTVQLSSAPPPADRVRGGVNAPDPLSDRASIDSWMRARNKQVNGRR